MCRPVLAMCAEHIDDDATQPEYILLAPYVAQCGGKVGGNDRST